MEVFRNIKEYFIDGSKDLSAYSENFNIFSFEELRKNENEGVLNTKYITPHKRDFFEIAIIESMIAPANIAEQSFSNVVNCLGVVSPFQVVSYGKYGINSKDIESEKMKGFVIYFKPSFFASLHQPYEIQNEFPFFKIHTSPLYKLMEHELTEFLEIANHIYRESKELKVNSTEVVRSLLLVLMYKIKRITMKDNNVINVNRFETILAKFENLIHSEKSHFYSVNEYAKQLNISAIYLTECIKKATGKSAQQVIIEYKLIYAQTILMQMNKSISEIGYELGFSEVSNFTKFFKRNTGITPKQFRNKKGM